MKKGCNCKAEPGFLHNITCPVAVPEQFHREGITREMLDELKKFLHIRVAMAKVGEITKWAEVPATEKPPCNHCYHEVSRTINAFYNETAVRKACCYCNDQLAETVKPVIGENTVYQTKPHGPFAPKITATF